MGKHKTQKTKLEILRSRLENKETIKNRDIQAAFGKVDYKIYEQKLNDARAENDESKEAPPRTYSQKKSEDAIKVCFMFMEREGSVGLALEEDAINH